PPGGVESGVVSAGVRELEAVVHDPCGREVPQVDVASEVRGDVQVEQAVTVVVEPDCAGALHAALQTGGLRHVLEPFAVHVLEQGEVAVAVDEKVLTAVVVEVAPYATHRDAFAGPAHVTHSGG